MTSTVHSDMLIIEVLKDMYMYIAHDLQVRTYMYMYVNVYSHVDMYNVHVHARLSARARVLVTQCVLTGYDAV